MFSFFCAPFFLKGVQIIVTEQTIKFLQGGIKKQPLGKPQKTLLSSFLCFLTNAKLYWCSLLSPIISCLLYFVESLAGIIETLHRCVRINSFNYLILCSTSNLINISNSFSETYNSRILLKKHLSYTTIINCLW